MRTALLILALLAASCGGSAADATSSTTFARLAMSTTTTTSPTTTSTTSPTTTTLPDVEPPAVSTVPANGDVVTTFAVVIEGTTEAGAAVRVNGVPVSVDPAGHFTARRHNDVGLNLIEIEATDAAGNTSVTTVRYLFEPPAGWIAAIGDSVLLGAKTEVEKRIGLDTVDAVVSRQFRHAPDLVADMLSGPLPPQVVIVALGTNGPVQDDDFDAVMEIAAELPLMVFVNVRVPRSWEATSNERLAAGVDRHPTAVLVDWWTPTHGRDDLFAKDGFHPKQPGRVIYAELIAEAVYPNWEPLIEDE